jgi:hypothetical protein
MSGSAIDILDFSIAQLKTCTDIYCYIGDWRTDISIHRIAFARFMPDSISENAIFFPVWSIQP